VIASDMPIGLVVDDANLYVAKGTYEAWANADGGAPSGRELELASLFSFVKNNGIRNLVWIPPTCTMPRRFATTRTKRPSATSRRSGSSSPAPINAGTFGPNALDAPSA